MILSGWEKSGNPFGRRVKLKKLFIKVLSFFMTFIIAASGFSLQRTKAADPVIFGEWTASGTRADVPLGSYYFQYSASFEDQGPVRVLCSGATSVNSSNAHFVTGDVVGNVKIVLKDTDTGEVRELINGNQPTAGVTIIDGTHKYALEMDSDGGCARVVCDKCGAVNYIYGSAVMLFRALGTYDAKVRTHPTTQTANVDSRAVFTTSGIHVQDYQWQMMPSGAT